MAFKLICTTVEKDKSIRHGADPHVVILVGAGSDQVVCGNAGRVIGVVLVTDKMFAVTVEHVQSTARRGDPEIALAVLGDVRDVIVAQAGLIVLIFLVDRYVVTVVPVQSILRTEPHESAAVLKNGKHIALGEAVFVAEPLELQVLILCGQRGGGNGKDAEGQAGADQME